MDLKPIELKPTKIGMAIANTKAERLNVQREIALLQREDERLFKVLSMLEKLEADNLLR